MAVAEGIFPNAKLAIARGQLDWNTADIRAVLINEDVDAPDLDVDQYLSAVSSGARSNAVALTNKVASIDGRYVELDHDPVEFTNVAEIATGNNRYEGLLFYVYNASEASALLVAYLRGTGSSGSVTNLPVLPNGGNIRFTPNDYLLRI